MLAFYPGSMLAGLHLISLQALSALERSSGSQL